METVEFDVNEMYSKVFDWFSDNNLMLLLISESEDIVNFINNSKYGDDNIIMMFRYNYDIIMTLEQLQELKNLIKSLKYNQ